MTNNQDVEAIRTVEKRILREEKKIEAAEGKIEKEEAVIEREVGGLPHFRTKLMRRISRHKVLYVLIITVGIVSIWRGIWEISENLVSSSIISILIGMLILWFLNRYSELL